MVKGSQENREQNNTKNGIMELLILRIRWGCDDNGHKVTKLYFEGNGIRSLALKKCEGKRALAQNVMMAMHSLL